MSSLTPLEEQGMIRRSWNRCYSFGFKPMDAVPDDLLTEQQVKELRQENHDLLHHVTPVLEKLAPFLRKSGQIALLVDPHGYVLHTRSDPDFDMQAKKLHLRVGANWHEQKMGTNAMGVALQEEKPVRIHGEQHFFLQNRFLTCAASPIFTGTGELAGVINISARMEHYHPFVSSLVCFLAEAVQNRLLLEQAKEEHLVTLKELEHMSNQFHAPLLTLDEDNRIIRANQAARRILGKDCIGKEWKENKRFVIETIADNRRKRWRSVAVVAKESKQQPLYTFDQIVGSCASMQNVKALAQKVAETDLAVLLIGETGTGKELFAQSIHSASSRAGHPFIAVNCSAIPENIIESELFGYEGGAFTGAKGEGNIGKFEAAHQGTLFLDEIGDMSLRAQAALLRVLQEKVITPVGSVKSKPVDVRIIAATNKDLREEIKANRFRSDLYYRLKGIQITLPPLRKRSDLIELAEHILRTLNVSSTTTLSPAAKTKLLSYAWPGNVRELYSVLNQAAFLAEGNQIEPEHLPFECEERTEEPPRKVPSLPVLEKEAIQQSLQMTRWNISKAARMLQISRNTLYRKMQEYNLFQP
ncbi:sigma-54-dependent Fis family transcriptional regulator [Brevibacillus sp. SYP-B805]|uniref:sigma-54-dependent Fis family transcriptional regulator n=1 Tax=Brevibacillus sp. SYP-B805 TaxID=1578199 RepID=UPI001F49B22D|nr:sigma-54-dependent Fis family transcriptional regulator [Brevibacillus sp. SYP-B805]